MALRCSILLAAACAGNAFAAPPPLKGDRTIEDYSYLADPHQKTGAFDAIKYIPLSTDGSIHLSLGGEIRDRSEFVDAPDFSLGGAKRDGYHLGRLLFHADLHLGSAARLFAQVGAHEAFGKQQLKAPDENGLDIQQLFLDLTPAAPLRVRIGRQDLMLNAIHRFVCWREGANVRQAFDGGRISHEQEGLRIEGFLTRPVAIERGSFDDRSDKRQMFAGAYVSKRLGPRQSMLVDAYWLLLDREDVAPADAGKERRHSVGARFAGAAGAWDWDAEAMVQFGRSGDREIDAWVVSADVGHTLAAPLKPRIGMRFDAGSGDDRPGDDELGSFHPLFPRAGYLSEANVTSWTNLIAIRPAVAVTPTTGLTIEAAAQFKWREDADDAVYVGPARPLPATRGNRAREIGQAFILDANYQLGRHVSLRGYYTHHNAGEAIRRAGGRPVDFLMATATFRF